MICGLIWLILALITAGILFGIGFFIRKKWKIMRDTPTRKVVDIEPGRVEIKGTIQPLPGALYHSPLTRVPCVQFELLVQEYRSSGKSGYWATIHTYKRGGPFLVMDDSGKVVVDWSGVKLESIYTLNSEQGMFNEMNSIAQDYVQKLGIKEMGALGLFKRNLKVVETIIPINKDLYVLGDASEEPMAPSLQNDPLISPFVIKKKGLMILSFKSEKQLADSKKTAWVLLYIFAGISAFLGFAGMMFLIF